ncbi:MAG: PEGA domain-containing protein [Deltaproteobacteria bacterium]|nr:PEGA domain-containing protein [Deltaproteobacteria bacterium]
MLYCRQARSVGLLVIALFAGLALWLHAAPALGQPSGADEAEGKRLAMEAFKEYQASDFKKALDSFEKARKLYPSGQVLRMTGYSLVALERWLEAADALEDALRTDFKPLSDADRGDTQKNLDTALSHLSTLSLTAKVDGATASIDGGEPREMPVKIRVLEGRHTVVAKAEGYHDSERSIKVAGGQPFDLEVELRKPEPVKKPKPERKPEKKPEEAETPEEKPAPVEEKPESPPEEGAPSAGWFPYQGPIGLATAAAGAVLGGVSIGLLASGGALRGTVQENIDAHNAAYGEGCALGDYTLCYYDIQLINHDGERASSLQQAGVGLGVASLALVATGVTFFVLASSSPAAAEAEAEPADEEKPAEEKEPSPDDEVAVFCGPFAEVGLSCAARF